MPTVLITGANRGLGLEYARQYSQQGWDVIACTRKPDTPELRELDPARVQICTLEVTDHAAIGVLASSIDTAVDALINNAGTTGPKGAPECMEYSGVDNMDYDIWRETLEVNLLGAFAVAMAFRPHLAKANQGLLVNLSSDLGSMAQNTMGNMYSYRSSKTALNMVTKASRSIARSSLRLQWRLAGAAQSLGEWVLKSTRPIVWPSRSNHWQRLRSLNLAALSTASVNPSTGRGYY